MTLEVPIPKKDDQDSALKAYQTYLQGSGVSLPGNAPLLSDEEERPTKLSFETWKLLRQFVNKSNEKSDKNSL